MASSGWRTGTTLNKLVSEQYGRFNVFQLMRLLLHKPGGAWPIAEHMRFRADLSEAFPGQEITRLRYVPVAAKRRTAAAFEAGSQRIAVSTANYCIASTLGPLPDPFIDWVRHEKRNGGNAMAAFFDIFNQRLNVLRYNQKSQQVPALDPALPEKTRQALRLAAIMGLAQPGLREQIPLNPRALLALSGLLANCRRSAAVVTRVLSAYLGTPTKLQEMVGAWRPIEAVDRIALGQRNHRLGQQSLLGGRMWDMMARVRLQVAPISYQRLCQLLPLQKLPAKDHSLIAPHRDLLSLLRLLMDRRVDCEVVLAVHGAGIPSSKLTAVPVTQPVEGEYYVGLRLGQTAWLGAIVENQNQNKNQAKPSSTTETPETIRTVRFLAPAFAEMAAV